MGQAIDLTRLKREIRFLAERLKDADGDCYRIGQGRTPWGRTLDIARYTRLCAFRATLRRRLHFAPGTDLAYAHWVLKVPCLASFVFRHPGERPDAFYTSKQKVPFKHVFNCTHLPRDPTQGGPEGKQQEIECLNRYKAIGFAVQRAWVADLFEEFAVRKTPVASSAGEPA
jgi:hypothetical protein